jgi:hypothetical protein
MTMVLPTFPERKVGRADGLFQNRMSTRQDPIMIIHTSRLFSISRLIYETRYCAHWSSKRRKINAI